ncbi:MAG: hypothetical protein ACUVQG_10330 [Thermogutta sp.]
MAEAPRSSAEMGDGELNADHARSLRILSEAFASLNKAEIVLHMPVALMITKWDRYSTINPDEPEEERKKLEAFLSQHPTYATLQDRIRNATALQTGDTTSPAGAEGSPVPGGLQYANSAVFMSSAFGRPELRDGKEFPSPTHGFSFGLLEPFIWLADRRDALDAAAVERRWLVKRSFWWLPWPFRERKTLFSQTSKLLYRVPPASPAAATLRQVRGGLWLVAILSWLLLVLLVGGLFDSLWGGYNRYRFEWHRSLAARPESSDEELWQCRNYFYRYALSRYVGLLPWAPSRKQANEEAGSLDQKIDDRAWQRVESAQTPLQKYEAANKYLNEIPNGKHVEDAQSIVSNFEAYKINWENNQWLTNCKQKLDAAPPEEQPLRAIYAELEKGFPHPDAATDEQRHSLEGLKIQCTTKIKDAQWLRYRKQVTDAIFRSDWLEAEKLLANPPDVTHPDWGNLVNDFVTKLPTDSEDNVRNLAKMHRFAEASEQLKKNFELAKQLENALQRHNKPQLAETVLQAQQKIKPIEQKLDRYHEDVLHSRVFDRTQAACERYLQEAPLGERKSQVETYLRYLKGLQEPRNWEVELRVEWDNNYDNWDGLVGGDEHTIRVKLGPHEALALSNIRATPGYLSNRLGYFTISGKSFYESLEITVEIVEEDPFANDDAGSGSRTVKIQEMATDAGASMASIPLRPQNGGFENTAYLRLRDPPIEPKLPDAPVPRW